jgi:hypothetical protein
LSVAEARVSGRLDKNKSQVKIDIKSLQEIFPARLAKINFLFEKTEAMTAPVGPARGAPAPAQGKNSQGRPQQNRKISDHKNRKISAAEFPSMGGNAKATVTMTDKMEFPTLAGMKRADGPDLLKAMRDHHQPRWNEDINYGAKRQVNKPCNQIPAERPSMPMSNKTYDNPVVTTGVFIPSRPSKKDFPGLATEGVNPRKEAARQGRKVANKKHDAFISAMEQESSEEEVVPFHKRKKSTSDSQEKVVEKKFGAGDFPGLGGAPEPRKKESNRDEAPELETESFPGLMGVPKNNVILGQTMDYTGGSVLNRSQKDSVPKKKGKKGKATPGGVDLNAHMQREWKVGPDVQSPTKPAEPTPPANTEEFPGMIVEQVSEQENLFKKMNRKHEPPKAEPAKKPTKKKGPISLIDEPGVWEMHTPDYDADRQKKLDKEKTEGELEIKQNQKAMESQNKKNMRDGGMFPGLEAEFVPDDQNIQ